ncbi:hypothetical protein TNCV_446701 [Trichonephila clavipes]|nr:hypothetical protein TNCV_446701 [Trichonephila clavipes]
MSDGEEEYSPVESPTLVNIRRRDDIWPPKYINRMFLARYTNERVLKPWVSSTDQCRFKLISGTGCRRSTPPWHWRIEIYKQKI